MKNKNKFQIEEPNKEEIWIFEEKRHSQLMHIVRVEHGWWSISFVKAMGGKANKRAAIKSAKKIIRKFNLYEQKGYFFKMDKQNLNTQLNLYRRTKW